MQRCAGGGRFRWSAARSEIVDGAAVLDGSAATSAYVYWIERRGRGMFLQATPIDVSQLLDEKLFDQVDTVDSDIGHAGRGGRVSNTSKKRLGLRNARTLVVAEPFRLSEAGAALRAAAAARSAQSGVHCGGSAQRSSRF